MFTTLSNLPALAAEAPTLLPNLTSFGAAGLIALMWLSERRASQKRDTQLSDAHDRILADRVQLDATLAALRHNADVLARLTAVYEARQPAKPEAA